MRRSTDKIKRSTRHTRCTATEQGWCGHGAWYARVNLLVQTSVSKGISLLVCNTVEHLVPASPSRQNEWLSLQKWDTEVSIRDLGNLLSFRLHDLQYQTLHTLGSGLLCLGRIDQFFGITKPVGKE